MKPSHFQEKIIDWVRTGTGNCCCNAVAGSGKCLGKNTPILMFDGTIKPVQEVMVGDTLMGDDNTSRTVISTITGTDSLFRINPVKGDSWICNSKHVLTLVNSVTNEIFDIALDEYLLHQGIRRNADAKLFRVPIDFSSSEQKDLAVPLDSYLAGLWLGDGTFTSPAITNASDVIRDYCQEIASNYGCELVVREEPHKNTRSLRFRVGVRGKAHRSTPHKIWNILKSEFCLENEKRIPRTYLLSSRDIRLQLLAGLLDTDGYNAINSGYFELTTKYTGLKEDILFLCRSLGFATYASVKSATIKKLNFKADYWRISIGGDIDEIPCKLHLPSPRLQKKNVLRTGFKVEPLGIGEYFGFELDNNGRFLLGDFTVTHNSSTLKLAALALQDINYSPSEIKICVFGKANSQDLLAKFGSEWRDSISTLHSIGWSLIKQHLSTSSLKIDTKKYKKIAEKLNYLSKKDRSSFLFKKGAIGNNKAFIKLLDLVRFTNISLTVENIAEVCRHFELSDIYKFEMVRDAIERCLDEGVKAAKLSIPTFDFADQIWLPVKWKLAKESWFEPYKFVLVDECQDLNSCQLELALSLVGSTGRLLFVGDKNQAIMGFSGADCNSYDVIVRKTEAIELPLSICYRCPTSHIKLVSRNFEEIHIQCKEDAIEGSISTIDESDLWEENSESALVTGDMVLSRKTAPLVSLCIKLISKGIAATVKGKAIGELIKSDLQEIAKMPEFEYSQFLEFVDKFKQIKKAKFADSENEEQLLETLKDKLEALVVIYSTQPDSTRIEQLEDYIDRLFSDDVSPITLSTCHRAKGLEAERVFIICPEDLPLKWKKQREWQLKQEYNLLYVALTRSKRDLFIVGRPDWMIDKEREAFDKMMSELNKEVN